MKLSVICRKVSLFLVGMLVFTAVGRGGETVLLEAKSLWRCRFVKGTEVVRCKSGKLEHTIEAPPWKYVKIGGKRRRQIVKAPKVRRRPAPPASSWTKAEFDDASWGLYPGPFHGSGANKHYSRRLCGRTRLIYLRGRFQVTDRAGVGDLTLALSFEGGVVVYLNGKEVTRAHMPKGDIDANTPAEDYPEEVYLDPEGVLLSGYNASKKHPEPFKKRVRTAGGIKVPGALLRKGVNVLAVELHFAPGAEIMYTGKLGRSGATALLWPRVGLEGLKLSARAGAVATPGAPHGPRPGGISIWNHPVVKAVTVADRGDPGDKILPVQIIGARNGVFSGVVVAGSAGPIKGLKAVATALEGPGTIPASAVEIRYPLPDGKRGRSRRFFDTLEETPRAEVPVGKGGAVQPVWIRVRVPADAKPGDYAGKVTLSFAGAKSVEVPVKLHVAGWTLPASRDLTPHMGFIQSPDSLAMKYNVKMWSEEHWKLVEKSFELLGQLGTKTLYIPLQAKTHFGNAHSMVRWKKKPGGGWEHDFSIVEKYVAIAVKHLGKKIPVVGLYIWDPVKLASNYAGGPTANWAAIVGTGEEAKKFFMNREILFSVNDPKTGKPEVLKGPKWGTPECVAFWKPVVDGVRKILAKHGLEKSMMVGVCGDFAPGKGAVDSITAAAPEAKWIAHSHGTGWARKGVRSRPVGCQAFVWGGTPISPDVANRYSGQRRYYGWKYPMRLSKFGRNEFRQDYTTQPEYRDFPEAIITGPGIYGVWDSSGKKKFSGTDGLGRMGADFWPVLKDKRGRVKGILAGHYVSWGGLDVGSYGIHYVIGPGKKGPIATARFEMLRECLQECEARIFLERMLTDPKRRATVGEALATRVQEMLDRRVRVSLDFDIRHQGIRDARYYVCSGWQERSRALYAAAAEVAGKLGGE